MSDFTKTLKSLARAKIASSIPLDEIESRSEDAAEGKKRRERRNAKCATLSHRATGRLVFSSTLGADQPKPLPHMKVELWDRDFGSPDDYLGAVETDAEGRFTIPYDPEDAGSHDAPDLELRVIDRYNAKELLLFVFEGRDNVKDEIYDFGDVGVGAALFGQTQETSRRRALEGILLEARSGSGMVSSA